MTDSLVGKVAEMEAEMKNAIIVLIMIVWLIAQWVGKEDCSMDTECGCTTDCLD